MDPVTERKFLTLRSSFTPTVEIGHFRHLKKGRAFFHQHRFFFLSLCIVDRVGLSFEMGFWILN
jgi:hypothetical protein|uniref:Uncharacterized protein n=1 Tax=Arabidopsis thaliana TaxID=3702 RepID=Q0WMC7_ARATH|nr:hypothetical protein [Arabidopsis thaliana]